MNMFATQGGVVELWVTKTDTYTSTKTGEIYASVQSIAPIPEGARGNAKGFEISEYNIEPTLLDAIVFEGQPVLCKFASVVRPTQDRFGRITNTQVLVDLLAVGGKPMAPTAQAPRPAQQPQGQDKQDKSPDAKA
ncbi:TPA: DNA-binding protein [Pseudomonas aeruginosa]|uniref:DNA-binding protein n=1 Tax=Pseudomonas aeruginosa TaxID=287 RepID=UPI000F5334E0|nr:DNA-binding protein [Pseudomonas aeruginosa]RQE64601.1 DNA-binding protein [Pseudomonas aeruginosa]HBO4150300.1 DNA-binding protein [Pseudomonas aeruginosa]HCF3100186.1 DNA-binding protein [Pseudomonas aeruginosa]